MEENRIERISEDQIKELLNDEVVGMSVPIVVQGIVNKGEWCVNEDNIDELYKEIDIDEILTAYIDKDLNIITIIYNKTPPISIIFF